MNRHEKDIIEQLEAMPFKQAREAITTGSFRTIGSLDHAVALSWLMGKEASLREDREAISLSISRKALFNSRTAIIIAIIAIILNIFGKEIIDFIKKIIITS